MHKHEYSTDSENNSNKELSHHGNVRNLNNQRNVNMNMDEEDNEGGEYSE